MIRSDAQSRRSTQATARCSWLSFSESCTTCATADTHKKRPSTRQQKVSAAAPRCNSDTVGSGNRRISGGVSDRPRQNPLGKLAVTRDCECFIVNTESWIALWPLYVPDVTIYIVQLLYILTVTYIASCLLIF